MAPDKIDFEHIDITDDFMFSSVMGNHKDLCRQLLEGILGFPIRELTYLTSQKTLNSYPDARGIRMDIMAEDTERIYNVEMQKAPQDDLPRRSRYYQSQLDTSELMKGTQTRYGDLKDTFIIFLCTFDPFGQQRFCYHFRYLCEEDVPDLFQEEREIGIPSVLLPDGTNRIFLNTRGRYGTIDPKLKEFIDYVNNPKIVTGLGNDSYIVQLDQEIRKRRHDAKWREQYMKLEANYMRKIDEGVLIGRKEGIKLGEARGEARGIQLGEARGEARGIQIFKLHLAGKSDNEIAEIMGIKVEDVERILKM